MWRLARRATVFRHALVAQTGARTVDVSLSSPPPPLASQSSSASAVSQNEIMKTVKTLATLFVSYMYLHTPVFVLG
jgi:hypothetical protein